MHFIKKILKTSSLIINDTLRLTEWIFLFSAFVGVILTPIIFCLWVSSGIYGNIDDSTFLKVVTETDMVPVVLFGIVAMIWLLITIVFFFVEIIVIVPFFLLLNIWVRFISFIIGGEALLLPAIPSCGK